MLVVKQRKSLKLSEEEQNPAAVENQEEKRRIQNRLAQRARRRRQAAEKPTDDAKSEMSAPALTTTTSTSLTTSQDFILIEGAHSRTLPIGLVRPSHIDADGDLPWRASTLVDPLRVLSPKLADPNARAVWQRTVSIYWPGREHVPIEQNESTTWSFFRHSLADPLLFHSLSWCNSRYDDRLAPTSTYANFGLHHQNLAIDLLRKELSLPNVPIRDEVVFAVASLAYGVPAPPVKSRARPWGGFNPPLTNLQWLSFFGAIPWVRMHKDALERLITRRGGLQSMTMPGLAELIQTIDLADVSHVIAKPSFQLCRSYRRFLETEVLHLRDDHRKEQQITTLSLPTEAVGDELIDIFWDMRAYTYLAVSHCDGSAKTDLPRLATHRNLIQHRLLSLEAVKPLCPLVRLGALIFSYAIIYPLPDVAPLLLLIERLREKLEHVVIPDNFHLWLLMVGGVAAAGIDHEQWYVKELAALSVHMRLKGWRAVKNILHDYLWMDRACNEGGLELWTQAQDASRAGN